MALNWDYYILPKTIYWYGYYLLDAALLAELCVPVWFLWRYRYVYRYTSGI